MGSAHRLMQTSIEFRRLWSYNTTLRCCKKSYDGGLASSIVNVTTCIAVHEIRFWG